jgi:hypothetical protein
VKAGAFKCNDFLKLRTLDSDRVVTAEDHYAYGGPGDAVRADPGGENSLWFFLIPGLIVSTFYGKKKLRAGS